MRLPANVSVAGSTGRPAPPAKSTLGQSFMKRPRGLWKSQKQIGRISPASFAPDDSDGSKEDIPGFYGHRSKRFKFEAEEDSKSNDELRSSTGERPSADIEDWEDLKELWADVVEKYESDALSDAVELLRGVVHECNRLLRLYPDPSTLFMPRVSSSSSSSSVSRAPSKSPATPPSWVDEYPQSPEPVKFADRPTAFHYMYGSALFLLGKILEADPTLAKEGEPAGTPAFYLAALDVFEMGETLLSGTGIYGDNNNSLSKEDWRMAVVWGRSLVCLADERLRRMARGSSTTTTTTSSSSPPQSTSLHPSTSSPRDTRGGPLVDFQDQLWPKGSAFANAVARRPPITRQVSLRGSTPHEILLQATDQFSRGMLHMPNIRRPRSSHRVIHHHQEQPPSTDLLFPNSQQQQQQQHQQQQQQRLLSPLPSDEEDDVIDSPPTLPGLGRVENKSDANSIRPRVLYTIASDVMSVAERLPNLAEKEYWAQWADNVFMQMEMEMTRVHSWVYATAVGRGRCWLIIGSAKEEALEDRLEIDDNDDKNVQKNEGEGNVLESAEALEAQEALHKAIEHFERSRAIAQQLDLSPQQDPYSVEVPPLLGEALVTLAALTSDDNPLKEQLFQRARAEGVSTEDDDEDINGNQDEDEEMMDH